MISSLSRNLARAALVLLPALSACATGERRSPSKSPDAVVVPEPASTPAAARVPRLTDENVLLAVRRKLESDPLIDTARLEVAVKKGQLVLAGTVESAFALERALTGVEVIRGVRDVVSRVQVLGPEVSDETLEGALREALMCDAASSSGLGASANRGVIVLEGVVSSVTEKQLAEAMARSVRGVREIDNQISLAPVPYRADPEIRADVERRLAVDAHLDDEELTVTVGGGHVVLGGEVGSIFERKRARLTAWVTGVRSVDDGGVEVVATRRDHLRRSRAPVSDEQLRSAVVDALRLDPRVDDSRILVLAAGGGVELKGEVSSLTAKRAVEADARNTAGVWQVTNRLTVRPTLVSRDEDLAVLIRNKLRHHAALGAERLDVSVRDARARIEGSVRNAFQRQQAEAAVAAVPGVRDIENRLAVTAQSALPDDETLESRIEAALYWDSRIDENSVGVDVFDGIAIVTGTVPDRAAYDAVLENVRSAGFRAVEDRLRRGVVPGH